MTSRFLAKVLYTAQLPNGAFERKIEQLVFEALTYTDCEAAVYKYMESVTRAEFTIIKIDRFQVDYSNTSNELMDFPFFLVKTQYKSVDNIDVKEKLLIQCESINEAKKIIQELDEIRFRLNDCTIKSIVETKITDYIYAEADEN